MAAPHSRSPASTKTSFARRFKSFTAKLSSGSIRKSTISAPVLVSQSQSEVALMISELDTITAKYIELDYSPAKLSVPSSVLAEQQRQSASVFSEQFDWAPMSATEGEREVHHMPEQLFPSSVEQELGAEDDEFTGCEEQEQSDANFIIIIEDDKDDRSAFAFRPAAGFNPSFEPSLSLVAPNQVQAASTPPRTPDEIEPILSPFAIEATSHNTPCSTSAENLASTAEIVRPSLDHAARAVITMQRLRATIKRQRQEQQNLGASQLAIVVQQSPVAAEAQSVEIEQVSSTVLKKEQPQQIDEALVSDGESDSDSSSSTTSPPPSPIFDCPSSNTATRSSPCYFDRPIARPHVQLERRGRATRRKDATTFTFAAQDAIAEDEDEQQPQNTYDERFIHLASLCRPRAQRRPTPASIEKDVSNWRCDVLRRSAMRARMSAEENGIESEEVEGDEIYGRPTSALGFYDNYEDDD